MPSHSPVTPQSAVSSPIPLLTVAVDAALDAALAEQRLVGAVVLIAVDGRIRYARAAGWADREERRAMDRDALFRLASVSKPIVSTAAMVRVAQGRLDLDAPIQRWLPDFRPALADGNQPDISVRQLLSHTAGLGYRFLDPAPDGDGPHGRAGVSDGMDDSPVSLAENLRRIARVPLQYAPGTAWGYSLATDVLGAVLEAVDGQPLPAVVDTVVTGPLRMHDTAFHALDPARLTTPYAAADHTTRPLRLQEGEIVSPFPGLAGIRFNPSRALDPHAFPSGGGGMVGSADDVMRLLEALRQVRVPSLTADGIAEMGRVQSGPHGPPDSPGVGFGLGFSVLHDPAAAASPESVGTWRWGGAYGHSWFVDPSRRLSVVALTNTLYEGMSGAFVTELRDAIYAGLGGATA
ncbi:beta-lactamase family protein [Pseudoxanthomonas sp. PXM04]|nr:serine hydrolase domain-containing protein [Pseudoxanthomonas sp. PXM04]MBD9376625.1 beta-lactamase family protein [Pseudoxanthomonas sp. PXM04]